MLALTVLTLGLPGQPAATPTPVEITLHNLPTLPVVWTARRGSGEPLNSGSSVLFIDGEKAGQTAIAAIDARSGQARIHLLAPPDIAWSRMQPHGVDRLLLSGSRRDGAGALGLLPLNRPGPAKLRWLLQAGPLSTAPDSVQWADDGSALALRSRARCALSFVDAASGRPRPPAQVHPGQHIERFQHGRPPTSTCEVLSTLHLLRDGLALVSNLRGHRGLGAIDSQGQTRWRIEGNHFRLLDVSPTHPSATPRSGTAPTEATFLGHSSTWAPWLFRVDVATGRTLWRVDLAGACASDGMSRHPQILGRRGTHRPDAVVLIQDCRTFAIVNLATGRMQFQGPHHGGLVLWGDVDPPDLGLGGEGPPADDSFNIGVPDGHPTGTAGLPIDWVDRQGRIIATAALDANVHTAVPVPQGVVLQNRAFDRVWLQRRDGAAGWSVRTRFGSAFRRDDHFVVLPQRDAKTTPGVAAQIAVHIDSGRAFGTALDAPYVLGRSVADPTLWLTTGPQTVVALRLPRDATSAAAAAGATH